MKRLLGSILGALLTVLMLSTTVSAAQLSSTDIESLVTRTNISIEQEIAKAQAQESVLKSKYDGIIGKLEKVQGMFSDNNEAYKFITTQIEETQLRYDADLNKLINQLVQNTNALANETIRIAEENGYTVICELVEVKIGDRVILIDPLRVADT